MTKSNVNPDHYKTAGRERQGEDIVQEIHKQKFTQAEAARGGQPGVAELHPRRGARRRKPDRSQR